MDKAGGIGCDKADQDAFNAMIAEGRKVRANGNWLSIDTAPKDGRLICSVYNKCPIFVAWMEDVYVDDVRITGRFWWKKRELSQVLLRRGGWRILILGRDLTYGVHGNYHPVELEHWMPLAEEDLLDLDLDGELKKQDDYYAELHGEGKADDN